jgi:two-component system, chemotaxis family, response regulator PixG
MTSSITAPGSAFGSRQLLDLIQFFVQSRSTARLTLVSGQTRWSLDFFMGRLTWAIGGHHAARRWQRLAKQYFPTINPRQIQLRDQDRVHSWEYGVLMVLAKRQKVERSVLCEVIQETILDVLFELLQSASTIDHYEEQETFQSVYEPIVALNTLEIIGLAQQQLGIWNALGLEAYSPNQVPVITDVGALERKANPQTVKTMLSLLAKNLTLRELAGVMKQDWINLARGLSQYVQFGILSFTDLPDLPSLVATGLTTVAPVSGLGSLASKRVLCVDDSIQVCQSLEGLLQKLGCQVRSVQDSVHALPALLDYQPDLIFLDLIMPVVGGHELCGQIRRISTFKNVPIIILTGNDGIVDRLRSKVTGASEFMSKPIDDEKVMSTVLSHLGAPTPMAIVA